MSDDISDLFEAYGWRRGDGVFEKSGADESDLRDAVVMISRHDETQWAAVGMCRGWSVRGFGETPRRALMAAFRCTQLQIRALSEIKQFLAQELPRIPKIDEEKV